MARLVLRTGSRQRQPNWEGPLEIRFIDYFFHQFVYSPSPIIHRYTIVYTMPKGGGIMSNGPSCRSSSPRRDPRRAMSPFYVTPRPCLGRLFRTLNSLCFERLGDCPCPPPSLVLHPPPSLINGGSHFEVRFLSHTHTATTTTITTTKSEEEEEVSVWRSVAASREETDDRATVLSSSAIDPPSSENVIHRFQHPHLHRPSSLRLRLIVFVIDLNIVRHPHPYLG